MIIGQTQYYWLVLLGCEEAGRTQECIFGLGDNASAIGWLYRTKVVKPDLLYYEVDISRTTISLTGN